ncbi:sodium-dependent bicarbonate transport family permease [Ochrovirga pacifica]|uniref:sodium-dependent bicarbonate transport family permease n=1 Tax=Ochrovirga pacifica TaxID=1042376 RepID=UPI0002558B15|nr:sodium-dependent bicarbonate transport family permease [Ochrovirga pacifica]
MNSTLIFENISNPSLLFFILGILAVQIKSDLEIPAQSSKFISIYLLLCIGFKGGQELSHSGLDSEIFYSVLLALGLAFVIPFTTFQLLKPKLGAENAGAIGASYGSVSAVTFVTACSFLDFESVNFNGYMIAIMALMEAPAIIVGILLIQISQKEKGTSIKKIVKHSLTNGSILLIVGSLVIGMIASSQQAADIKPFTTDIFKGFLAVFLLDMGIKSGKHIKGLIKNGIHPFVFSIIMPFVHGLITLYISFYITDNPGNQLLFAILGSSASYIAVPAVMKESIPKANPGLYLPMALGITFPVNIIIGIPFYYSIIQAFSA